MIEILGDEHSIILGVRRHPMYLDSQRLHEGGGRRRRGPSARASSCKMCSERMSVHVPARHGSMSRDEALPSLVKLGARTLASSVTSSAGSGFPQRASRLEVEPEAAEEAEEPVLA